MDIIIQTQKNFFNSIIFYLKKYKLKNHITPNNFVLILAYYYLCRKFSNYLYKNTYLILKSLKPIQNKIKKESGEVIKEIKNDLQNEIKDLHPYHRIPTNGFSKGDILKLLKQMKPLTSFNHLEGKVSGAVYSNNKDLDNLLIDVYPYFMKSNPLHTNVFPSIRKMENDLVNMMIHLFNGDKNVCGTFTSGGTESILLACKTYKKMLKKKQPNIIVSSTAHCAFKKACQMFDINYIEIPSLSDGKMDLKLLSNTINENTILVVASAPSYNLGIIDPIYEISQITTKYKIPLHIDCCMGAFLANFLEDKYDFSISGVTSISADFHKYGMSPKGASVILYKNKDILANQYFIDEKWSGGVYATSTIAGSKSGNIVSLTWVTLLFNGYNFYKNQFRKIVEIKNYFVKEIEKIDCLFVYGEPELNIIAVGSNKININILGEKLKEKKWNINMIQNPSGFHFCITSYHTIQIIGDFIEDVKSLIPSIPNSRVKSKCIYGTMKSVNDSEIVQDIIIDYLHLINDAL